MDEQDRKDPPAGRRFGRYLLLEALDRGGMADVYRAVSHGPGGFRRQFVIKRIRKEKAASKDFVEMFVNEARISALIEHPNVVQVYDFGQVDGDYFLAMEYLRGANLLALGRRLRKDERKMPMDLAAYAAREVARGLHHAHTLVNAGKPLGIVHRDVSPSNIMLLRTGGVKLLDFGIARATMKLRSLTPVGGMIKGKLSYLSPEQVRGKGVDGRSDVFSLGVVLWECLTGLRLFYNPNDLETMRNVLHRTVPRPSELRAEVPARLDAIVLRALERDLERRYPDAGSMASDLEDFLRECRFSPEQVARLLDELFGEEDSAREVSLPDETSVHKPPLASTRLDSDPAFKTGNKNVPSNPGSLAPTATASEAESEHDDINGYATVSAVHRLAELAQRQRRRRFLQIAGASALAAGVLVLGFRSMPEGPASRAKAPVSATAPRTVGAPRPRAEWPAPTEKVEISALTPSADESAAPENAAALAEGQAPGPQIRPLVEEEEDPAEPAEATRSRRRPPAARLASATAALATAGALTRGVRALADGQYMLAKRELEAVCRVEPRNHEALRALAEAEFELALYSQALSHARRAVALAPDLVHYQTLLGDALYKLRKYDRAIDAYASALALAPNDSSIRRRYDRTREKIDAPSSP